jgi:hypothetical protein
MKKRIPNVNYVFATTLNMLYEDREPRLNSNYAINN